VREVIEDTDQKRPVQQEKPVNDMDDVMERLRKALKEKGMTDDEIDALSDEDDALGDAYYFSSREITPTTTLH
jgi:hypothetical protein